MDEISAILHGCKLARELEMTMNQLQEMVRAEKSSLLLDSCVEIVNTFTSAIIKLNPQSPLENSDHIVQALIDTPAEIFHYHAQQLTMDLMPMSGSCGQQPTTGFFHQQKDGEESLAAPVMINVSTSRGRSRRREDSKEKICLRVPDQGNSDQPPPDGHVWRKYGQKEILRSKYPRLARSYYRCTHSKLGCEAKKQVQRVDDNYYMFHVTYSGSHTCQTLFKVPSSFECKHEKSESEAPAQLIVSTSIKLSSIFNVEEFAASEQQFSQTFITDHPFQVPSLSMKNGESSGIVKEMDNSGVDLVDVMFGCLDTSNTIDTIFTSKITTCVERLKNDM